MMSIAEAWALYFERRIKHRFPPEVWEEHRRSFYRGATLLALALNDLPEDTTDRRIALWHDTLTKTVAVELMNFIASEAD